MDLGQERRSRDKRALLPKRVVLPVVLMRFVVRRLRQLWDLDPRRAALPSVFG